MADQAFDVRTEAVDSTPAKASLQAAQPHRFREQSVAEPHPNRV
jgi:hypothetical protein